MTCPHARTFGITIRHCIACGEMLPREASQTIIETRGGETVVGMAPVPAAPVYTAKAERLFAPVDVMPGQLAIDDGCGFTPLEADPPNFARHGLI